MRFRRGTRSRLGSTAVLAAGVAVVIAVGTLEYGSAATGTIVARASSMAAHSTAKQTKAEKIKKALKACKKKKPKSARKECEEKETKLLKAALKSEAKTKREEFERELTKSVGEVKKKEEEEKNKTTTTTAATTTGTTGTTTGKPSGTPGEIAQEKEKAKTATKTPSSSQVAAGKALFDSNCESCHGANGEGADGDEGVPYSALPRAQSVEGVILQLIEPELNMPDFDKEFTFESKEELADYVTVDLTHVTTEG